MGRQCLRRFRPDAPARPARGGMMGAKVIDLAELRTQVPDQPSDEELLRRCRDGEAAAWSTLVRRYQRLVYTIPLRAGLGEDAAGDVFQVTFSRLFENLERIADGSRVRAWLVTTAKRESLALADQERRRSADTLVADEDGADPLDLVPDDAPLADEQLERLQQHDQLRRAVDRLDPRSRQFVELAFLSDEPLSYGELAARLGMAEGSIGPTRQRCLEKLRQLLAGT